jgi:hypothetical protein
MQLRSLLAIWESNIYEKAERRFIIICVENFWIFGPFLFLNFLDGGCQITMEISELGYSKLCF